MKLLILLALCGLSLAATIRTEVPRSLLARTQRTLQDDLNDFLALIPVADIEALFLDYLANDAEMQNAMTYLQSDEFEGIVLFVDSQPEVQDLLKYLVAAGLDVVTWLNGIHDFLGIPHIVITKRAASGRTLAEFWEKVKALIPIDALKALYADKLVSSPDFKALIDKITSAEFHNMVLTVKALPEVQALRQRLLELGIDVEAIEQFVRDLFGWNRKMTKAARTLQDDLNDFLALIPVADIEALFLDYLANDAEMQNAMTYLQSDEFEGIVLFVDSQPEVQDLLKYLVAAGLDVVTWLNGIHDFLGIPHIVITKRAASGRTLAEFWEKVKALIPIDALKALYADKLVSSPDFKALIDKITSAEFHNMVLTVKALPEVQALRQRLLELGIDVEAIEQFVRDLFGWNRKMTKAARTLQDDLNDFLALIPVADIEALFLDYLANDAEMQNAMTYLQSDEFEGIVLFVDSQPEVQDLLKYLVAAGLDVVTWLNGIHDFLGIPHIVITKRAASGRTLAEFWEKVKALIPIDALKALYADKLVSSPDFKALIDKITSAEFHNMVLTVKALPEVQALRQRLLELGIDVEAIEQFVRDLFGWNRKMTKAARTLQDDLNDFLALIPVADIEALFLDYLANDAEMQNAMTYLQSDEFEGIVLFVDSQPEVQDLLKYLVAAGLDVVTWLNGIHDFLGIPHIVITKRAASGRTLAEFWEKVKALIPIDALKALYADKLVSSPDFKALIDKITSDEFHNMVLTVKALPEVQAIRQRLLDLGIDVEAIEQFVRDLFGW